MFDLEQEVHRWCRKMSPGLFRRGGQTAELEDHLHCAISRLMQEGIPAEEAFRQATLQFGDTASLRDEYRKNWHWLLIAKSAVGYRVSNWRRAVSAQRRLKFHLVTAFSFSGAIIASGVVLQDTFVADWAHNVLIALYLYH